MSSIQNNRTSYRIGFTTAILVAFCVVSVAYAAEQTTPVVPSIDDCGGPDFGGYRWRDDSETNGPAFEWINIHGGGLPFVLQGVHRDIDIGFSFPFYDSIYSTCHISSSGWLSFMAPDCAYTVNQGIPATQRPNAIIAPYWDNLFEWDRESVRAARFDTQRFVITWNVTRNRSVYEFQAILHSTGKIVFQYNQLGAVRTSASIGIENHTGQVGLSICHNEDVVRAHSAIEIDRFHMPSNPSPTLCEVFVFRDTPLSWSHNDYTQRYIVLLDTVHPPARILSPHHTTNTIQPPLLLPFQRYYWQVISTDSISTLSGPIWQFTTGQSYHPAAPIQAWISEETANSLQLNWFSSAMERDGYIVYRSINQEPFQLYRTVRSGDSTSIELNDLSPFTCYRFQVFSYLRTLSSITCAEVTGWTRTAMIQPPGVHSVSYNWVALNIENHPETPNPINARYAITDELSGRWVDSRFLLTSNVPVWIPLGLTDSMQCVINNLSPLTDYRFAVYCLDSTSYGSARTVPVNVRTTTAIAPAPLETTFVLSNPDGNTANNEFGKILCSIGDVDNDGKGDFLIGQPNWDNGSNNYGQLFLARYENAQTIPTLFGPYTNPVTCNAVSYYSSAIADAGDIDNDGSNEFILSSITEFGEGEATVYSSSTFTPINRIQGARYGAFGESIVVIGDVTDDGVSDYLISDPLADIGVMNSGAVYLYDGYRGSLIQTLRSPNPSEGGQFGYVVAKLGDMNSDGKSEFAIAAPNESSVDWFGAVYIYDGDSHALLTMHCGESGARFGATMAGGYDVNQDEVPDYFISATGARNEIGDRIGAVSCYDGATQALLYTINSPEPVPDGFGANILLVSDVTGDDTPDLLISASGYDCENRTNVGKVDVYRVSDGRLEYRLVPSELTDGLRFGSQISYTKNHGQALTLLVSAFGLASQNGGLVYGFQSNVDRITHPLFSTTPTSFQCSLYPNPVNSQTKLRFSLPATSTVRGKLFDVSGREIGTPMYGNFTAGEHISPIAMDGLPSGMYYLSVESSYGREVRKIVLVK